MKLFYKPNDMITDDEDEVESISNMSLNSDNESDDTDFNYQEQLYEDNRNMDNDDDSDFELSNNDDNEDNDDDFELSNNDDNEDNDDDDEDDSDVSLSSDDSSISTSNENTKKINKTVDKSNKNNGNNDTITGDDNFNKNDEDEDDVIKAIKASTKASRNHPPDITIDDFVVDLSFHPDTDLLAVGTITGDIFVYKYSTEENQLVNTFEVHTKAIRDIEFDLNGQVLFSTARDKSIMLTDIQTGKLKQFYDNAHETAIYRMNIFNENLFATGDDDGVLKVWDIRDKSKKAICQFKEVDDYISGIITNEDQKLLLTTSGDGYLTAISLRSRKMFVQSEPYEEELTAMGLFRNETKLIVGTSKGRLYTFDWGKFGLHSNMFPGPKSPISLMIPITERMAIVSGEEGILRAMHVDPGRNLGIVGQHSLGVEAMDISNNGEYIASSSHNNDIKFWNIKYFEDFHDIKYNEKHNKLKEQRHNLPSSKIVNPGDFFSDLI